MKSDSQPALELGGSHVSAALVDLRINDLVPGTLQRLTLDASAPAAAVLDTIADAARSLGAASGDRWGIAVPGPFDYAAGVAAYRGVGKFDALYGVDFSRALRDRLGLPMRARYLNDAAAFGLGEWQRRSAAADGHRKLVAITLGTGVGSAFIADGQVIDTGATVPPEGRVDLLEIDGRPFEALVSTRAIVQAYRDRTGTSLPGLRDIATRAEAGDHAAHQVVTRAMTILGQHLVPWLNAFGASCLVIGGSISAAWDLIAPAIRNGLRADCDEAPIVVLPTVDTERSALVGAARAAHPTAARSAR